MSLSLRSGILVAVRYREAARLRPRLEVAALRDAIDVAVGSTEMHPGDIVLALPVHRSPDDGHARRSKFLRSSCHVVDQELDTGPVVKCSFSEGPKTSTLLPSGSWKTQTPSPLWLKRRPRTRPKKSAVASGFTVRVPTHPILRSFKVERLPCPHRDVGSVTKRLSPKVANGGTAVDK
jgi:hypothetical protein